MNPVRNPECMHRNGRNRPESDPAMQASYLRLLLQLFLPEYHSIPIPRFGPLVVRVTLADAVDAQTQAVWGECEALDLDGPGCPGQLLIDRSLALCWVHRVVGLAPPLTLGPLSRIERGIMEGVSAVVASYLGLDISLRLYSGTGPRAIPHPITLAFLVECDGLFGRAWLRASPELIEQIWASWARGTKTALRMELARTDVPCSDLAGAGEGDLVVFEGTAPLSAGQPWPLRICMGARALPARLLPDGAIVVEGDQSAESRDSGLASSPLSSPAAAGSRGEDLPCAAGVEVVHDAVVAVEIGNPELQGKALLRLLQGEALCLPRTRDVHLTCREATWAEGIITEIDGALAVQITRRGCR